MKVLRTVGLVMAWLALAALIGIALIRAFDVPWLQVFRDFFRALPELVLLALFGIVILILVGLSRWKPHNKEDTNY